MYEDSINAKAMERPKPTICIEEMDFPAIKDAKIGEEMTITCTVIVKSLSMNRMDTAERKNMIHADLQIVSMKKEGGE
jgi:hypothetical protein